MARPTIEDWLRIPEEMRPELIGGRLVAHSFGIRHGYTKGQIGGLILPYDRRRNRGGSGGGGSAELGGWWISQTVEMIFGEDDLRPDIVGWRRDKYVRVPEANSRGAVVETPDFVCEVLSASTARYDLGEKREVYFRAGVPHYWLVNPNLKTLTMLERTDRGYLIVKVAGPGEVVRAVPFEGVEIPVDELFIDEEGELGVPEPPKPAALAPAKAKSAAPARSKKKASAAEKKHAPRRVG